MRFAPIVLLLLLSIFLVNANEHHMGIESAYTDEQPHVIATRGTCPVNEATTQFPIKGSYKYLGGPLMTSPISFFVIWYGTQWSAGIDTLSNDLKTFVSNLGTSQWYSYTAALTDSTGKHITTSITWKGEYRQTNLKFGTALNSTGIKIIVQDAIAQGKVLSSDLNNSLYYVILGDDVTAVGTCSAGNGGACGWHSWFTLGSIKVKYGTANQQHTTACAGCRYAENGPLSTFQSNNMMKTMCHEIIETVSDPLPGLTPGWTDSGNQLSGENGDLCSQVKFNFQTLPSGKQFNAKIGSTLYLLQPNLDASTACCALPPVNLNASVAVSPSAAQTAAQTAARTQAPTQAPTQGQSQRPTPQSTNSSLSACLKACRVQCRKCKLTSTFRRCNRARNDCARVCGKR